MSAVSVCTGHKKGFESLKGDNTTVLQPHDGQLLKPKSFIRKTYKEMEIRKFDWTRAFQAIVQINECLGISSH